MVVARAAIDAGAARFTGPDLHHLPLFYETALGLQDLGGDLVPRYPWIGQVAMAGLQHLDVRAAYRARLYLEQNPAPGQDGIVNLIHVQHSQGTHQGSLHSLTEVELDISSNYITDANSRP
ncbi:hypothetical protein DSECCO2_389930 [anaerobic digester metagenome]